MVSVETFLFNNPKWEKRLINGIMYLVPRVSSSCHRFIHTTRIVNSDNTVGKVVPQSLTASSDKCIGTEVKSCASAQAPCNNYYIHVGEGYLECKKEHDSQKCIVNAAPSAICTAPTPTPTPPPTPSPSSCIGTKVTSCASAHPPCNNYYTPIGIGNLYCKATVPAPTTTQKCIIDMNAICGVSAPTPPPAPTPTPAPPAPTPTPAPAETCKACPTAVALSADKTCADLKIVTGAQCINYYNKTANKCCTISTVPGKCVEGKPCPPPAPSPPPAPAGTCKACPTAVALSADKTCADATGSQCVKSYNKTANKCCTYNASSGNCDEGASCTDLSGMNYIPIPLCSPACTGNNVCCKWSEGKCTCNWSADGKTMPSGCTKC